MFNGFMANNAPIQYKIVAFLVFVWILVWKGVALWKAAKYDQRNWYIVILLVNTLGLLEIIYLFKFAKKPLKLAELMFWK